ncbi:MAG TPA: hypothetical protein VK184_19050 [Nostocaceae cyanobacterium]|nr:hypothetical protein [Nostocaceae cyanobacterium]
MKYYLSLGYILLVLTQTSSYQHQAIASTPKQILASTKSSQSHRVFQPILPKLKQKTKIKILLPQFIPNDDGVNPIYAIIENSTPNQYAIILGYTPNCNGGTACRLGAISGEAVTAKTPRLTGKKVSLAKGITGYFLESRCGANCSDATLTWRQQNVQYTFGIKAGRSTSLIKMANSAIHL